ncbi:unnamed protein product [Rotaria sp. Silwood1]|nr:unnamed protein product [Rotaria sp. Silwood1]CAF1646580.1 unnamed protein product [Rotaria sp. Silwood1]CAF3841136.1 unnamed protein product [Rotaria sp. Silwood1]CAF4915377.1 unnamed protein product [Rotaria sp. Silwood1]
MYSQIFKEILLDMTYGQQAIKDLVTFCQQQYLGNTKELNIIDEFERTYRPSKAIWWYTRECFTRDVSLEFAKDALGTNGMVGILFQMTIDPTVSSIPFASIREVSYFPKDDEILFSMHAVFRIGDIQKLDNNRPLYQVNLKLTSDDDPQLRQLTNRLREEIADSTGWTRLGKMLLKLDQLDKAEELFTAQLEQTSDESDKAFIYNELGRLKSDQG